MMTAMIRGVSRFTVEINQTGSPYFERAICFVRPEFAKCDKVDLHRAARLMVGALDSLVEDERAQDDDAEPQIYAAGGVGGRLARIPRWAIPVASALGGAGAAMLAALAIR